METATAVLAIVLLVSLFLLYLMNARIRQLRKELSNLRAKVAITGEELMRLSTDIEDFKKIKI